MAVLISVVVGYFAFSSVTGGGSSGLNGLWLADSSDLFFVPVPDNPGKKANIPGHVLYEFSGRKFTYWLVVDNSRKPRVRIKRGEGTFSITDGRIEFIWDGNNRPDVQNFSRTENTITLGYDRFTRSQANLFRIGTVTVHGDRMVID